MQQKEKKVINESCYKNIRKNFFCYLRNLIQIKSNFIGINE